MTLKKWTMTLGVTLLAVAVAAQDAELKTQKERVSYALGMEMGGDFHSQSLDIDLPTLVIGLVESYNGGKTQLTEDQMRTVLASAREEYRQKQAAQREEKAQATLHQGLEFLAENKKKEGVISLPSGLQYKILKQGEGEKPEIDEEVVCNYRGTLIDGTEFDSSEKHSGPVTVSLTEVIKGWKEALLMMPAGSKWQLFVPPHLAYGKEGSGLTVPPNATLVFELEFVAVKEDYTDEPDKE
jgi:FKBP-type peptidyl-prolyl cis-trans isomerase